MAWSYSGDPNKEPKDTVRYLVGDTVATDPLSTDEEIEWALSATSSNVYKAAALVAQAIATKFATMKTSVKIGPITEEYGNRAEFYAKRAKELEAISISNAAFSVYVGGTTLTTPTSFKMGMTDYTIDDSVTTEE